MHKVEIQNVVKFYALCSHAGSQIGFAGTGLAEPATIITNTGHGLM